jgi:hypothetical protein
VWKAHPEGGLIGLGTSPSTIGASFFALGSAIGTEASSACV